VGRDGKGGKPDKGTKGRGEDTASAYFPPVVRAASRQGEERVRGQGGQISPSSPPSPHPYASRDNRGNLRNALAPLPSPLLFLG
jgi:hypothetical protein